MRSVRTFAKGFFPNATLVADKFHVLRLLSPHINRRRRLPLPELQTFRRTLMRWRHEVLAYSSTGFTNGRSEGFNNKAKVVLPTMK